LFKQSYIETLSFSGLEGLNVDILRDDTIHKIVSGNKWRKLKYIIKHLKENNFETMVSFGGAYSNHLLATAFAGHYFNIKTVGFVRGDEQRAPNYYETECIKNGMQLIHVSRTDYKNKPLLFEKYFANNNKAFFIDEGGKHELAYLGCQEIANELKKTYDYIVLSLGTGTTMKGLLQGIVAKGLRTKVLGISSLKNNFELDETMAEFGTERFEILHNYHRGKYGKMDAELLQFIPSFYAETGIKLDPIYTAKMVLAVMDLKEKAFFKKTDRVLIIHTGGIWTFQE